MGKIHSLKGIYILANPSTRGEEERERRKKGEILLDEGHRRVPCYFSKGRRKEKEQEVFHLALV